MQLDRNENRYQDYYKQYILNEYLDFDIHVNLTTEQRSQFRRNRDTYSFNVSHDLINHIQYSNSERITTLNNGDRIIERLIDKDDIEKYYMEYYSNDILLIECMVYYQDNDDYGDDVRYHYIIKYDEQHRIVKGTVSNITNIEYEYYSGNVLKSISITGMRSGDVPRDILFYESGRVKEVLYYNGYILIKTMRFLDQDIEDYSEEYGICLSDICCDDYISDIKYPKEYIEREFGKLDKVIIHNQDQIDKLKKQLCDKINKIEQYNNLLELNKIIMRYN